MSEKIYSHDDLITAFAKLGDEFGKSLKNAQEQQKKFEEQCRTFQHNMQNHVAITQQQLSGDNPMAAALQVFTEQLEETNTIWQERVTTQDKGVKFREGFNDSLLVFVYGKVKSGKSSLGNYIAWGHTDPSDALKQSIEKKRIPEFFSGEKTGFKRGDANNEAEKNKEFRVGATEATSTIQGFSLAGLTWVDSPGTGSVNEENGRLAQDYVQHSDLVLCTMSSDQPGRASDIKEILNLYKIQDKRLLILLTGSDTTEEDEDENGEIKKMTVMKSQQTRKMQQKAVRDAMIEALSVDGQLSETDKAFVEKIEIISFSARYAQENQANPQKFIDSGMPEFFDVLSTVAMSHGVKLKQQTPLKGFKNYLKSFYKEVNDYEQDINHFKKPIEEFKIKIPNQIRKQTQNIWSEMDHFLNTEFAKIENKRDVANAQEIQSHIHTLQKDIQNQLSKTIQRVCDEAAKEVVTDFSYQVADIVKESSFLSLPDFEVQTKRISRPDFVVQGTQKRNTGIGAVAGAAIGGLVGSVVPVVGTGAGATVGGFIGGIVGRKSGRRAEINYIEEDFRVGDNFGDIRQKINENVRQQINTYMKDFENNMLNTAVQSGEMLINNLQNEINDFKSYLVHNLAQIDMQLQSLD